MAEDQLLRRTRLWPLFNLKELGFASWKPGISRGSKKKPNTGIQADMCVWTKVNGNPP